MPKSESPEYSLTVFAKYEFFEEELYGPNQTVLFNAIPCSKDCRKYFLGKDTYVTVAPVVVVVIVANGVMLCICGFFP